MDMVGQHPGILARQQGLAGLCQTCQECPVVTSCGGGLYTHRYRAGSGFDNPSVYCADLLKLISHISRRPPADHRRPGKPDHALSEQDFRALAAGLGDAATVKLPPVPSAAWAARPAGRGLPGRDHHPGRARRSGGSRPPGR